MAKSLEELLAYYATPAAQADYEARRAAAEAEEAAFEARCARTRRDRIARNIAMFGDPDAA